MNFFYITELTNVCNYPDVTTFHACDSDSEKFIQRLEHYSMLAFEWFESNYMKLSNGKCHKLELIWGNIGQSQIWESKE